MKIVPAQPVSDVEKLAVEPEQPTIGRWYWYKIKPDAEARLGTVHHVGSNYVELIGPSGREGSQWRDRIHFDDFDAKLTYEPNAAAIIASKVADHREESQKLLREVQRITAALGVAPRQAIAEEAMPAESTTALAAVASTENIKAHKQALILAKDKQLPDLFKQIESEHALMAHWMKANTLPDKARLAQMKGSIARIDGQIFTVELYAGLIEEVVQVRKGAVAPNDTKLVLFQRRHYMDEEALVNYEAGGMEFADLAAFDAWIAREENFKRILPSPRCVVSFKVRRFAKKRQAYDLSGWIRIIELEKADKLTFLYLRNGEQLHRLSTEINFGDQFFPDQEHNELLMGGTLWWDKKQAYDSTARLGRVRSQRDHDAQWDHYREQLQKYEQEHTEYKSLSKKERSDRCLWEPDAPNEPQLTPIDAKNVYYDDAMDEIAKLIREHNQIAVLLQGLLDRSRVFHPHPPWQLWTPAGFLAAIELIYDDSRAIAPGDAPDFLAYAKQLNEQITEGSMVIGQRAIWGAKEAEKENVRRANRGRRDRWDNDVDYFEPHDNPGPAGIAKVERHTTTGRCTFKWERNKERLTETEKWEPNPDRPGWLRRRRDKDGDLLIPKIPEQLTVDQGLLFNVSAYKPGDFRQFFDDPRTRAQYLKWAPFLLLAEDFHASKKIEPDAYFFRKLIIGGFEALGGDDE